MPTTTIALVLGMSVIAQPGAARQPTKSLASAVTATPQAKAGPFHIEKTFNVGGEGGWDLLAVDSEAHRLYVPRGNRVMVIDTESGQVVGEIADTAGVHGVAIAAVFNRGFTSNGRAGTVTIFDLKTLKTLQTVKAGENPDAILFEPVTKTLLCFNGKSHDATVINAEDGAVLGTIAMGGQPELPAADGTGKVYVNIEDTSEVLRVDPKSLAVEKRFPLAPGDGPTGLAIDIAHKRLFAACRNERLVVIDAETGKVLATPAIGKGVDGADFDVTGGFVLTSNGGGRDAGAQATLSVISTKDNTFEVIQTLPTSSRARTLVLDPKTRRAYLPSAEYETPKEAEGRAASTACDEARDVQDHRRRAVSRAVTSFAHGGEPGQARRPGGRVGPL
jgi:DNA-binding beta-propeller fold protein YncE